MVHHCLDQLQIRRCIDRVSYDVRFRKPHTSAVLQQAQHINRLRTLERRRWKPRKLLQTRARKRNHAHLLQDFFRRLFEIHVRNWSTGELECVAVSIGDDFDRVWIEKLLLTRNNGEPGLRMKSIYPT